MIRFALRLAVLVCVLTTASSAAAATLPSGFEETTLVSGLTRPTGVAWTPDGRTLVTEQDGLLKVANPGQSTAHTILDIRSKVNSGGDRGLLGMAVDSDFQSNGYVYLLYTYELSPLTPDGLGPMVAQMSRIKLNASSSVLEQQTILGSYTSGTCPAAANTVDCIPSNSDSHSIGTVRAAPDGTLFVSVGDGAGYNTIDPLAFRTYDERSLAGKILHVDRNGAGLAGHPFCPINANLSQVCTKVWAKGFRNPFRFTLSPTGGLIVGDVGWGTREEIDVIPSGGGSYGWPCREGIDTNPYWGEPQCQPAQLGPQIDPVYDYPHPPGNGGSAVVGGPQYTGTEYPVAYQGSIIFGDYVRGVLSRLTFDGPGGQAVEHSFASGLWDSVNIVTAPGNGDIVYVSFGATGAGSGTIQRIVYSPGNARPVAHIAAAPLFSPTSPLTVNFNGAGSSDADHDPLSYSWDFGDGDTSGAIAPSHTYDDPGTYTATLTVEDGRGKSDSETVSILVGNSPPDPPQIDFDPTYRGGGTIELHGAATDPEDGALDPDSSLSWDVKLVHNDHNHPFFHDRAGANLVYNDLASHDADSFYEVKLTATDSAEATTTSVVELHPETTTITIASDPPGARISYYDKTFTAPTSRLTAIGLQTGVAAEEGFTQGAQKYVFSSWSDGGAQTHPLTVPATPLALTARYLAVAGPPAPDTPPATKPAAKGPQLLFDARHGLVRGKTALRGTAQSSKGVARVAGALYRTAGTRCRFWSPQRRGLTGRRSCGRPLWIAARLSGPAKKRSWRLDLRAPLPRGVYRLRLRADDRAGVRSTRVAGAKSIRLASH